MKLWLVSLLVMLSVQGATQEESERTKPALQQAKTVQKTITSRVAHKDLGYYKMFSYHYPFEFSLLVNGKELKENEQIPLDNDQVTITYAYAWKVPWGTRRGKKQVQFTIEESQATLEIYFDSWDAKERIRIPGAIRRSCEVAIS